MDLKMWLWKNRISLTDFCHIVGFSRGYMSEVMNYHKKPSERLAHVIEKETGGDVRADFLMSQEYKDYFAKSA